MRSDYCALLADRLITFLAKILKRFIMERTVFVLIIHFVFTETLSI